MPPLPSFAIAVGIGSVGWKAALRTGMPQTFGRTCASAWPAVMGSSRHGPLPCDVALLLVKPEPRRYLHPRALNILHDHWPFSVFATEAEKLRLYCANGFIGERALTGLPVGSMKWELRADDRIGVEIASSTLN